MGKHTRRYFQAECFCSLDVEHSFVFRRSLHREVGWFLALENAVDVGGGKPIQRGLINPEGASTSSAGLPKRRAASLRRVMAGPVLAMHIFGQIYSIHFERGPPCQKKRSRRRNRKPN